MGTILTSNQVCIPAFQFCVLVYKNRIVFDWWNMSAYDSQASYS